MLAQTLVGALVITVAVLVALDAAKGGSPHGHADGLAHDVRPRIMGATLGGRTDTSLQDPANTAIPTTAHDAGPTQRPESISPSAGGQQRARTSESSARQRSGRGLRNWHVRTRLLLLVIIPTVTVAAVASCVARIASALHGASTHSAILSALTVGIVVIIVLASWFTIVIARSVLRPLHRLQAGALEVTGARLADAVRRIAESNGHGLPPDVETIDVDSVDEIGEVARGFDQMRREMLRLAANEATLRGKLNAMFANMSHRSQSLVERQIRLIENLEQGEHDAERLANLFKMTRIATRMHRNSENLLILAGHELSTGWNQPVALANVIRAALSEIEDNERVSLKAQPDIAVRGPAVNDVVHLLAELIENATSFSAANMPIDISGHVLTSGGVLVDITDRGIGMTEKEMTYANWQLENPPAADINIPKWMGLFVVARLAARHSIRVRLNPAEFGGLTALVWFPDEVMTHQGAAASPRLSGFASAVARPGLHEAAVGSGHASAGQTAAVARSTEFATRREDVADAPVGRRLISDPAERPGTSWSASGVQTVSPAEPPATVSPAGSRLPAVMGEHAGASVQEASGGSETPQLTSAPLGIAAPSSREPSSADGGVIVPAGEGLAEARRLPIFDQVESLWFSDSHKALGSSGLSAPAGSHWSSPADEGWHAAETIDSPSLGGSTAAGLPKRLPNANLVPGAITGAQPVGPQRSAAAARDRFAGFQRGLSEGRAAASEAASPGGEGES